jgi:EAL domain-containing protein (putative c-di-GMP-specific phosphodiesterase class I)/CheY-like chemotaxis protein
LRARTHSVDAANSLRSVFMNLKHGPADDTAFSRAVTHVAGFDGITSALLPDVRAEGSKGGRCVGLAANSAEPSARNSRARTDPGIAIAYDERDDRARAFKTGLGWHAAPSANIHFRAESPVRRSSPVTPPSMSSWQRLRAASGLPILLTGLENGRRRLESFLRAARRPFSLTPFDHSSAAPTPALATDASTPAAPASTVVPQPRILLLDDNPFELVKQSCLLREAGFGQVTTLETAAAALESLYADARAFDVIVCDVKAPSGDGLDFLRSLEASPFAGQLILLSGECARVVYTARLLLARAGLVVLGTVKKSGIGNELAALLEHWVPGTTGVPSQPVHMFGTEDIENAASERQWVLHYQPKVDLRTGRLAGVEALVRWNHPVHGLVLPDRFIGLAEQCGAIETLTDWVLHEGIGQLARWRAEGLLTCVALNVSMDNLRAPDFTTRVENIVKDAGVSTADVTLEITESRLMASTRTPLESLMRLRLGRFNLSIDDFGTGHSSLAQLRDVPFTELKVDRSFVSGARADPIVRTILESCVGLAKGLGMLSVAEGVETDDDWRLLRDIGCNLAQGYFIGRPMPSDGIAGWLDAWQHRHTSLLTA